MGDFEFRDLGVVLKIEHLNVVKSWEVFFYRFGIRQIKLRNFF